ncbi:ABC transporter substrate-binding protein [Pasteurella oralis]|uniref:ABC transporter substrate-binding protein n=1 Tax=Pasteurella oralis TaxID=1071947 RepID=UPI000C7DC7BE|nr:ABC transporter substrate-binding protein [Pasteurella oralis]
MRAKLLKRLTTFIISLFIFTLQAKANELVIGTTFALEGIQHLVNEWNKQPNTVPITTLNRTSTSLNQLLSTEKAREVDLILSSSPMLFYNLQKENKLLLLPKELQDKTGFLPNMLKPTTVAFALSGYGMLFNKTLLQYAQRPLPQSWQDLTHPDLQGLIVISSPTRSDTNHIMLEALLQKHGWQEGWALIEQIMLNVGTISARSFGVVDKIQANLGAVGITIDNYAHILTQQNHANLAFHYFPQFPASPTFIAIVAESSKKSQAIEFIQFLLSEKGQRILTDVQMSKYPIVPLPTTHPKAALQQQLFQQPPINYDLLLKRQQLVKLLFEQHITHRLGLLQEHWRLLQQKEQAFNRPLLELRQILTALPVSAAQAEDEVYLTHFNRTQELLSWQHFFIAQQVAFVKALEDLE